jgi:hypothetical protein
VQAVLPLRLLPVTRVRVLAMNRPREFPFAVSGPLTPALSVATRMPGSPAPICRVGRVAG